METLGSGSCVEVWQNAERAMAKIVEIFSNIDDGRISVREFWCSDELNEFTYEEIQKALASLFDMNLVGLGNGATEFVFI